MYDSLVTITLSLLVFVLGCIATLDLYRKFDVLPFTIAVIAGIGALVDYWSFKFGVPDLVGFVLAIAVGALIGIGHVPVLMAFGRQIFLLISVVIHIFFLQWWLAFPEISGGSAGLFFGNGGGVLAELVIFLALFGVAWVAALDSRHIAKKFVAYSFLRLHGPRAGIFGIRSFQMFAVAFAVWGAIIAGGQCLLSRHFQFVSVAMLNLALPVNTILIVVYAAQARWPMIAAALLSATYIGLRVVIHQFVATSQTMVVLLDVVFPLIVIGALILTRASRRGEYRPKEGAHGT